jgi:hypothetical protein
MPYGIITDKNASPHSTLCREPLDRHAILYIRPEGQSIGYVQCDYLTNE